MVYIADKIHSNIHLCQLTDSSLPKIGDEFGGRDHTTVMHAHDKITQALRNDPLLEKKLMK